MTEAALSQRLRASGIWAASGRILSGVLLLLLHGILTRQLVTRDYGRYVLIESAALVISIVCMAGIPSVTLRLMRSHLASGETEKASRVVNVSAWLFLATSSVTAVITVCGSLLLETSLPDGLNWPWMAWFLAWAVMSAGLRIFSEIYRAFDRYSSAYLVGGQSGGLLLNASMVVLSLAAISGELLSLTTILALQISVQFVLFLACTYELRVHFRSLWRTRGDSQLTVLLLSAWPLLAQQLVSIGLPEAGKLLVGVYANSVSVGFLNAATRLVILAHVPLMIVNNAIQPFITELHVARNEKQLETLVRGAATLAALPSLVVFSVFLCCPELVLKAAFGAEFTSAASALQVLTLGSLAWVLSGSCGLVLMMTGHEKSCMLATVIPGVAYLVVCPWLIGQYGFLGAAIGATLLQFVSNGFCMLLVYRHHGFWTCITLSKTMTLNCVRMIRGSGN